MNVDARVAKILSLALNRAVDAKDEIKVGTPPEWDSLKQIEIMLLIEEEFSTQIPPQKVAELVSQRQLIQYLGSL